jgi:hypothetical protein
VAESYQAWFADTATLRPRAVTCVERTAGTRDSEGNTMFVNTHFATEAEAWTKILREAKAGQSLAAGELRRCRERAEQATKAVADAALERDSAERAFAEWERANGL